jgi:NAD(P)H-dependent FMN reductase
MMSEKVASQKNTDGEPINSNEPDASILVTAVCGSLNSNSVTKMALETVLRGAAESGVTTRLIELADYEIPFFGQFTIDDVPPDVQRLRKELDESRGIILGTPEYHGSLSGALKSMLDLMSSEQFEGKIVGLVGVAGGHTGAIQSLNALRTIGRNLHCWVLPEQVSVAESNTAFEQDGKPKDSAIEQRLMNLGQQVALFATVQRKIQQEEFMKMWEGMPRW